MKQRSTECSIKSRVWQNTTTYGQAMRQTGTEAFTDWSGTVGSHLRHRLDSLTITYLKSCRSAFWSCEELESSKQPTHQRLKQWHICAEKQQDHGFICLPCSAYRLKLVTEYNYEGFRFCQFGQCWGSGLHLVRSQLHLVLTWLPVLATHTVQKLLIVPIIEVRFE